MKGGKNRQRTRSFRIIAIILALHVSQSKAFSPPRIAFTCIKPTSTKRISLDRRSSSVPPLFNKYATSLSSVSENATDTVNTFSDAAEWHRRRRKAMIHKYGDQILPLERSVSSQNVGLPLLMLSNLALLSLSLWSASLSVPAIIALAIVPGSMFSLWQLQILHDCLHGSLLKKRKSASAIIKLAPKKKTLQDNILFWGSMPSVFGYYLYLKFGHLTHHTNLGDASQVSLAKLFDSDQVDFEDGDMLFVAHRMKLLGDVGPTFAVPSLSWFNNNNDNKSKEEKSTITMSISKTGFNSWKENNAIRNACIFATTFMYERLMLVINDCVVALTGKNYFFPNKPASFHQACAKYARCATAVRLALLWVGGWKSLLFLYLSETLWSIPPHPAAAMFVTNHPSSMNDNGDGCTPSMSTYAGTWYSLFTLGTNYHCEHHDFPTIPLHRLYRLRQIAPEYYRSGSSDNLWKILQKSFGQPDFYACMNSHVNLA